MDIKIAICPDVFQNVMSKLNQGMEYVKTYLDDLLILSSNSFKHHLLKLQMVLARISTAGMRVNASKSKFFSEQIEYLGKGYWITRQGIQFTIKWKPYLILRLQKPEPERNYGNILV
jgi:Reverse transcriptase (RNA-dependent DNA polymerase)